MILSRHPQSQVLVALVDRRQAVVAAALSVTFSHILHLTKTCRHDDDDDDDDAAAAGGGAAAGGARSLRFVAYLHRFGPFFRAV